MGLQNGYGAWSANKALASLLCLELAELTAAIRTETQESAGRIWATALALAFLELSALDREPTALPAIG